ncbi:MAG: ferrous iron transport protein B [Candidatus Limivicinus sp.]
MGLTRGATGRGAQSEALSIERLRPEDKIIALAGNPNVGKSTIFNTLTGLKQHTGNWPGKTVSNARGYCRSQSRGYVLVDVPGAYSLAAVSPEETLARDFICFGSADAVLLVCDGSCPERNMKLLLQIMETGKPVLLCVNLLDEAESKGIHIDLITLERQLGVPVIGTVGRDKASRPRLLAALDALFDRPAEKVSYQPIYPQPVEQAVAALLPLAGKVEGLSPRFTALRLLEGEESILRRANPELLSAARQQQQLLAEQGLGEAQLRDLLASTLVRSGETICARAVENAGGGYGARDRRIDRVVTSRRWGYPLMIALLALIFYITISGANVPSQWLSKGLFWLEDVLAALLLRLGAPAWLRGLLVDGAFRTLAWVTSVMLPPMAIFFPLFTLMEDSGYLPRIAYNLDRPFCRCGSCGRQALTMAMGFGCNAAGVVGCRIIQSPRERLLAILTNSLVPCNGRFPTLIALLTMFFMVGSSALGAALGLTGLILLAVGLTLLATKLLSVTALKGEASAFVLELPPYRRPELGKVILRSVLDRTLFVLGRAAAVAAPAGALLWLLANVKLGGVPVLTVLAGVLEPLGRVLGMDGVILLAFILGFPANEIVLPIAVMIYSMGGSLTELGELAALRPMLVEQGWTEVTALCVMLFSLCHWPCSTTLLTIKKETGSAKWTVLAALLPTAMGVLLCMAVNALAGLV